MDNPELRRYIASKINREPGDRAPLEEKYGRVWDTAELQQDFEVLDFAAPFVIVTRKTDGAKGSLTFQHHPRFYFDFVVTDGGRS